MVNVLNLNIGEVIDTDERAYINVEHQEEYVMESSLNLVPGELWISDDDFEYILKSDSVS